MSFFAATTDIPHHCDRSMGCIGSRESPSPATEKNNGAYTESISIGPELVQVIAALSASEAD